MPRLTRRLVLSVLLAWSVPAGCGGGHSTATTGSARPGSSAAAVRTPTAQTATVPAGPAVTQTTAGANPSTTTAPPARTTPRPPPPTDCQVLGMTQAVLREGPCTHGGLRVYVANKSTTVKLTQLDVRLDGITTRAPASGATQTTAAQSALLLLTLTVTNRLSTAKAFDAHRDQTALFLGGRPYPEVPGLASSAGLKLFADSPPIGPGRSRTAAVAFEVPVPVVGRLASDGDLRVLQFSDAGRAHPAGRVAVIRTYH